MKNHELEKLNSPGTLYRRYSDSIVASHLDFLASNGSFSQKISHVASKPAVCSLLLCPRQFVIVKESQQSRKAS